MLLLGADGLVPGYGNVDPVRYTEMWKASREGKWDEVRRLQDEICAGFEIVFVPQGRSADATGIGAFKTAMEAIGIIATNEMAFPVQALKGETKDAVLEIVKAQGLI
jgi:dihydrodipicolinate synthase